MFRDLDLCRDLDLYVKGDIGAFNESFPDVKIPEEFIGEIINDIKSIPQDDHVNGITACNECEPIGFVVVALHKFYLVPYAYIETIYVEPAFRGRGIGRSLLKKAEEWGSQHAAKFIQLHVSNVNAAAIRSYERSGFKNTRMQMEKLL